MGLCFASLNILHTSGSNESTNKDSSSSPSCNKSKVWEMESSGSGKLLEMPNLKVFSYGDLKIATKSFKSDALLGEGGFGKVYKGWLNAETLAPAKAGSGMMVAIKQMKPDSLQGVQEWQNYNAKISDFGLAKFGPSEGDSHVTTRIMGTFGYVAPEYIASLTDERMLKSSIMDCRLEGQYSPKAALETAKIILKCLESDPKKRPSMNDILEKLESIKAMKDGRKIIVGSDHSRSSILERIH